MLVKAETKVELKLGLNVSFYKYYSQNKILIKFAIYIGRKRRNNIFLWQKSVIKGV